MISLTLLHPIQSIPVQSWTFEHESVIKIGRSIDNHVILYSAVVSRHHVELRLVDSRWEIVSLGANGTYLDGKRITQVSAKDGVIIRLARSGPNIQIHIGPSASGVSQDLAEDKTLTQRIKSRSGEATAENDQPVAAVQNDGSAEPSLPVSNQPEPDEADARSGQENLAQPTTAVDDEDHVSASSGSSPDSSLNLLESTDTVDPQGLLFCQDSGQPLRVLHTVVEYQVIKTIKDDGLCVTQVVWRNGQSLLLKTLSPEWLNHPKALEMFEQQAKSLLHLSHPAIPRFVDFFSRDGQPYLVLEWLHGQDLKQQVAIKGPLSSEEAIATLLQVCDVLDYLHHQSLPFVHQDIRPSNLIQRSSGFNPYTVSVVGFISLRELTIGKQLVSSSYIAPEQQQGNPVPASDLYALGPTLVYLLTGKEPSEFYAQREQGFRFYPEYIPGFASELVTIVRKLTNPKPEERYGNAGEVAEALNKLVE